MSNTTEDLTATRLAGRMARCYCGNTTPSIAFLDVVKADREDEAPAFFEYRGPHYNEPGCVRCGMDPAGAISRGGRTPSAVTQHPNDYCDTYEPDMRDEPTDLYYCGCDGYVSSGPAAGTLAEALGLSR